MPRGYHIPSPTRRYATARARRRMLFMWCVPCMRCTRCMPCRRDVFLFCHACEMCGACGVCGACDACDACDASGVCGVCGACIVWDTHNEYSACDACSACDLCDVHEVFKLMQCVIYTRLCTRGFESYAMYHIYETKGYPPISDADASSVGAIRPNPPRQDMPRSGRHRHQSRSSASPRTITIR